MNKSVGLLLFQPVSCVGRALESLKAGCAATKEPPVTFLSSRACAFVTLGEAGQLR